MHSRIIQILLIPQSRIQLYAFLGRMISQLTLIYQRRLQIVRVTIFPRDSLRAFVASVSSFEINICKQNAFNKGTVLVRDSELLPCARMAIVRGLTINLECLLRPC